MGTSLEEEGFSFTHTLLAGICSQFLTTEDGGWVCIWSLSLGLSGQAKWLRTCREPVEVAPGDQGWLGQWGTWWWSEDLIAPFNFLKSCRKDEIWLFVEVLRGRMRVYDPKFGTAHCLLGSRRRHFLRRWWISQAGHLGVSAPEMSKPSGQSPKQPAHMSEWTLQGTGAWTWDLQTSLPSYCFVILRDTVLFPILR